VPYFAINGLAARKNMAETSTLIRREQLPLPVPYAAPRTPTERTLAAIWRKALNMDQVGIDDDYNDLGGDSFLAAVIFAEILDLFTVKIPMAALIDAPTIARLAPKVDKLAQARRA
jgi:acyl carrier protein